MAAKVAVLVVPAVLGAASIRVYTVKEKPADGLLPRERLNIYTPLSQNAPAVPERPGVIQSGIATARESIQPFVQASTNAYSSVKTGSVKLYHTLEDVYYYLKDPPPEFLPRFGTITMAGLLGMFLARKGSRFKRTLVPLGLMSGAASVCYPAQAVAVVKVTGKKVYAAGQWSGAAVSSLFASKPREPVAQAPISPQPQAEVPVVEPAGSQEASEVQSTKDTSGQSATIPQAEAASPESVPVSDQPVTAALSEEVSSVTLAEVPPSQTPTDTGASGEEPTETKQGSSQPDPEVSAPTVEPEPVEPAPIEPALIEATPIETTLIEPTLIEPTLIEPTPIEPTPIEPTPIEAALIEPTPIEAALIEPTPIEAALIEPTLIEAAPIAIEAVPIEPTPIAIEAAQIQTTSAEAAPAEVTSVDSEPSAPVAIADPPQEAAADEMAAEHNRDGSGFKADPALMDFGQSSPEDEDLYSTRS